MVKRTDNPFRDLCISIAGNETIFLPFIRICLCSWVDSFNSRVVYYDLYALGIQKGRNVRKLQIWKKRSRKKIFFFFTTCFSCAAWSQTFLSPLDLSDPCVCVCVFCRLVGSPGCGFFFCSQSLLSYLLSSIDLLN